MPGEPFDPKRIHHLHLGAGLAFVLNLAILWEAWIKTLVTSGKPSMTLCLIFGISAFLSDGWLLDDVLWHKFGWKKLPGHILHEWLNKNWGWYTALDRWVKKQFK